MLVLGCLIYVIKIFTVNRAGQEIEQYTVSIVDGTVMSIMKLLYYYYYQ